MPGMVLFLLSRRDGVQCFLLYAFCFMLGRDGVLRAATACSVKLVVAMACSVTCNEQL